MAIENIILVDPNDREIGEVEKHIGHQFGMLHRAFSVCVFRTHAGQLETLLQQRSETKYHGGGLWTNACCSHPHPGENIAEAAHSRLKQEMGIEVTLEKAGKFHYLAVMDHGMTENEIDHVFIGTYEQDEILFDPEEVQNFKWLAVDQLKEELQHNSKNYTPWLKQALDIALAKKQRV